MGGWKAFAALAAGHDLARRLVRAEWWLSRNYPGGPYRAGDGGTNAAYSNLPNPKKCLTKIGDEAGRHCGDVIGIGRIGFLQSGQGAPAPPQPQALPPKNGRSG